MTGPRVRVVVADDEPLVREGLAMILGTHPGLEVVGRAADGAQALAACADRAPDVLLLDLRMPVLDGFDTLAALAGTAPRPAVVVLTTFDQDADVRRALGLGAAGYLLKSSPHERIAAAVRAAAAGEAVLDGPVLRAVIRGWLDAAPAATVTDVDRARLDRLSPRELEVLALLGDGLSNDDLGARLHLSLHTVKTHVSRVLAKTDCTSRLQAAALAHRCAGEVRARTGHEGVPEDWQN